MIVPFEAYFVLLCYLYQQRASSVAALELSKGTMLLAENAKKLDAQAWDNYAMLEKEIETLKSLCEAKDNLIATQEQQIQLLQKLVNLLGPKEKQ